VGVINLLIKISNAKVLGWEPSLRLERRLAVTFEWIAAQVLAKAPVSVVVSAGADCRG